MEKLIFPANFRLNGLFFLSKNKSIMYLGSKLRGGCVMRYLIVVAILVIVGIGAHTAIEKKIIAPLKQVNIGLRIK